MIHTQTQLTFFFVEICFVFALLLLTLECEEEGQKNITTHARARIQTEY